MSSRKVLAWAVVLFGVACWIAQPIAILLGHVGWNVDGISQVVWGLVVGSFCISRGAAWLRAQRSARRFQRPRSA
jgi:hypothetical protein